MTAQGFVDAAGDVAALAGEHGDLRVVARALGVDPDELALFGEMYAGRPDAHPPAFRFQMAVLLGIAFERRRR